MECNGNLPDKAVSDSTEDLSDYTDADESISAPTEILAEFLSAVMLKDYDAALKYCKMILQYEPNHATAKEFYPLILEKIIQASAEAEAEAKEAEGTESDSESEESSSSETSDSESVEGEEEEEVDDGEKRTTDSDATTASYSSLEDEEADNAPQHTHSPGDDNAFISTPHSHTHTGTSSDVDAHNNNYSDSESPTEPVSQAQLAAALRRQVISGQL